MRYGPECAVGLSECRGKLKAPPNGSIFYGVVDDLAGAILNPDNRRRHLDSKENCQIRLVESGMMRFGYSIFQCDTVSSLKCDSYYTIYFLSIYFVYEPEFMEIPYECCLSDGKKRNISLCVIMMYEMYIKKDALWKPHLTWLPRSCEGTLIRLKLQSVLPREA